MPDLSFDINNTKALLIGVSDYLNMTPIKPAIGNVNDFYSILTNPEIIGLPESSIIKILNKSHQEIFENIIDFFNNEEYINTETLIFYYVGHGYREINSKELYLTGINTNRNSIKISGIPFNEIKQIIENSFIQKRIVIIDACHSGLATMGTQDSNYTENELDIIGTYVLTSSASNEKSFFESNNHNTFFTKEIISIFEKGLPTNQPFMSLDDIYVSLQKKLQQSKPQRKTNFNSSDFFICKNTKYNIFSQIEKEADDLFDNAEYEKAKNKYLDVHYHKPNEAINRKIEKCDEYIRVAQKVKEKEELNRKQEEERIAREQEALKRKQEEVRIAKEQEALKRQQEEERIAREQEALKHKQEEVRIAKEQEALKRKQEEVRIAKEQEALKRKQEEERIAREHEALKRKQKNEQIAREQEALKNKQEEKRIARDQAEEAKQFLNFLGEFKKGYHKYSEVSKWSKEQIAREQAEIIQSAMHNKSSILYCEKCDDILIKRNTPALKNVGKIVLILLILCFGVLGYRIAHETGNGLIYFVMIILSGIGYLIIVTSKCFINPGVCIKCGHENYNGILKAPPNLVNDGNKAS